MALTFKEGDFVWAKMKGWPYWPGQIAKPPKNMMKKVANNSSRCIFFFGTYNYSWIDVSNLKHYAENKEQLQKANKTKGFLKAVEEANDHWTKPGSTLALQKVTDVALSPLDMPDETPQVLVKRKASEAALKSPKQKKASPISPKDTPSIKMSARKSSLTTEKSVGFPIDSSTETCLDMLSASDSFKWSFRKKFTIKKSDPESLDLMNPSDVLKAKKIRPSPVAFGFVGIGLMGERILKNLVHSNHKVLIWNRTEEKCEKFQELGVDVARSQYHAIAESNTIFICLPDSQEALSFLFSFKALIALQNGGKSFVNLSGISSDAGEHISLMLEAFDCRYLEARMIGTPNDAKKGTLTIIAAGNKSVYNDCESCFKACSQKSLFLGENIGNFCDMYVLLSAYVNIKICAIEEIIILCKKVGLSVSQLFGVLLKNKVWTRKFVEQCLESYQKTATFPMIVPAIGSLFSHALESVSHKNVSIPMTLLSIEHQVPVQKVKFYTNVQT